MSGPPTMREIAELVAERHHISLAEIRSASRARRIAWPRQEAMDLIRAEGRYSLPQIGRFFGNRHHTTVLHAVREVKRRRMNNPQVTRDFWGQVDALPSRADATGPNQANIAA